MKFKKLILLIPTFIFGCSLLPTKPVLYGAYMSGDYEVPTVKTSMVGNFSLSSGGSYTVNIKGIKDANQKLTVSHIHCGKVEVSGPPVYTLFTSPNVYGNSYTYSSVVDAKKFTPNTKTDACPIVINSMDTLREAIEKGYAYVNVHTVGRPAGEIRGQISKE